MIVPAANLSEIRQEAEDKTIALRFGCYDLLHHGHVEGIEFTAAQADLVVVAVASDDEVTQRKGPSRPIYPAEDRLQAVNELPAVDYSFIKPKSLLATGLAMLALKPDVVVAGQEQNMQLYQGWLLSALGIRVVIDEMPNPQSSSAIINSLALTRGAPRFSGIYGERQA